MLLLFLVPRLLFSVGQDISIQEPPHSTTAYSKYMYSLRGFSGLELAGRGDSVPLFPGGPAHMIPCVHVISFMCKASVKDPNRCENK